MTRAVRILLLGLASVAALTFASSALAAFTPRMAIGHGPPTAGSAGITSIRVTIPRDDEALFKATIFGRAGYPANRRSRGGRRSGP